MRFRMLGPLEVWSEERGWAGISAGKWRSLLACLLLKPGQIVPTETLIAELWGDAPPPTANNLVSIYVHRLRGVIGDSEGRVLVHRRPGYQLRVADDDTDVRRFESLVADARRALAAGEAEAAATLLGEAEGLWRDSPFADVAQTVLVSTESGRITELHLAAAELRVGASLTCGRHADVVPELRSLVAENPLREGLWLLLMRALDGAGRHAEALETYGQARTVISDELGVDPGPELQRLYAELLSADSAPPLVPPPREPSASSSRAPAPEELPVARGARRAPRPAGEAAGRDEPGEMADEAEAEGTIALGEFADDAGHAGGSGSSGGEGEAEATAAPEEPSLPRLAQLPADIGDFTGRAAEVRHLRDMVTRRDAASPGAVRIVVVAGAAGLGKTTLAVHAAHQIRDLFPDGQLYVDLSGASAQPAPPGEVLARFLRDLGIEGDKIPASEDERGALYRTRLTGRRVLVMLDNARDAAQIRPLLPGSASCAVLVTTRNRTPALVSTRFVDLNRLSDPEALELFTRIVDDGRPAAEPDATAEVLLACAGLPLAVRICAARLAVRRQWKVATLANRLRDSRSRLDEMQAGDLEVRASFQVSYDALRADRHRVDPARAFRLLGLWHGRTISLSAATALIGAREGDVAVALERLVDANLLESPAPDRYQFHDLLRVYATERAEEEESSADRAAAVERLLRWYLDTADAAAKIISPHRYHIPLESVGEAPPPYALSSMEDALAWYDGERANLVAATRQASSSGLHDIAWQLPTALLSFYLRRNNWADCVTAHSIALDSVRLIGHQQGEGWVLNNLGMALTRMRDKDKEGIGYLEKALAIRREIGDRAGEAQAASNLADAYYQIHGPDVALDHFLRALAVLREEGPSYRHGILLNNLGEVYLELGRVDGAVDSFKEARTIFTGINSANGHAYSLQNLGRSYMDLTRGDDALECLREALALHRSTGDLMGEAQDLEFLGRAHYSLGNVAEARDSWTAALDIFTHLGETDYATEVESALRSLGPQTGPQTGP